MATFTPPADNFVPPVAVDSRDLPDPLSNRLFRYYKSRPRGRNVFILTNNTVTEDLPALPFGPVSAHDLPPGPDYADEIPLIMGDRVHEPDRLFEEVMASRELGPRLSRLSQESAAAVRTLP